MLLCWSNVLDPGMNNKIKPYDWKAPFECLLESKNNIKISFNPHFSEFKLKTNSQTDFNKVNSIFFT